MLLNAVHCRNDVGNIWIFRFSQGRRHADDNDIAAAQLREIVRGPILSTGNGLGDVVVAHVGNVRTARIKLRHPFRTHIEPNGIESSPRYF